MSKPNIYIFIFVALLTACSSTLPLQGSMNNGAEPFLGTATGSIDGSGTLSLNTQDGVNCNGTFQYADSRVSGTGRFSCEDGRTGNFQFTSNGTSGKGFGKTSNGEPFKFFFGHTNNITRW